MFSGLRTVTLSVSGLDSKPPRKHRVRVEPRGTEETSQCPDVPA